MTRTTFDRWSDLPRDLKLHVVDALHSDKAVAAVALVNREMDGLSREVENLRWRSFLLGNRAVQGPLPKRPRAEVGRIYEAMKPPPPSNLLLGRYAAASILHAHGGGFVEFPDGRCMIQLLQEHPQKQGCIPE